MRKLVLIDTDDALFNLDIEPAGYSYLRLHLDAFKRMWQEQGRTFWVRYLITYRSYTFKYGCVKAFPGVEFLTEKYKPLADEAFGLIHRQFVAGKCSSAKNMLSDIATLAENKHLWQYIDNGSLVKDPFYCASTREPFRNLFGMPTNNISMPKVYMLSPVYVKFAGSLTVLLRRWLDVPREDEVPVDGCDDYWDAPEDWREAEYKPFKFEFNLAANWASKLYDIVKIKKGDVDWLDQLILGDGEDFNSEMTIRKIHESECDCAKCHPESHACCQGMEANAATPATAAVKKKRRRKRKSPTEVTLKFEEVSSPSRAVRNRSASSKSSEGSISASDETSCSSASVKKATPGQIIKPGCTCPHKVSVGSVGIQASITLENSDAVQLNLEGTSEQMMSDLQREMNRCNTSKVRSIQIKMKPHSVDGEDQAKTSSDLLRRADEILNKKTTDTLVPSEFIPPKTLTISSSPKATTPAIGPTPKAITPESVPAAKATTPATRSMAKAKEEFKKELELAFLGGQSSPQPDSKADSKQAKEEFKKELELAFLGGHSSPQPDSNADSKQETQSGTKTAKSEISQHLDKIEEHKEKRGADMEFLDMMIEAHKLLTGQNTSPEKESKETERKTRRPLADERKASRQRICANCGAKEITAKSFKKCGRCKEENFPVPRYYCGRICQAEDWTENHCNEHGKIKGSKA